MRRVARCARDARFVPLALALLLLLLLLLLRAPAVAAQSTYVWQAVSVTSAQRVFRQGAAATAGGNLVHVGGFSDATSSYVASTVVLTGADPSNAATVAAWSAVNSSAVPSSRLGHTVVRYPSNGRLYLFGGFNGDFLNDVWEYNPSTDAWLPITTANTPPSARFAHSAAIVNTHYMYIFGGKDSSGSVLGDLYSLQLNANPPSWALVTPSGSAPGARMDHSAVVHGNGCMFILGGRTAETDSASNILSTMHQYCVAGNAWTQLASIPLGRFGHGAQIVGARNMVVFGGYTGTANLYANDLYEYDRTLDSWNLVVLVQGSAPAARRFFGTAVVGSWLYVSGGQFQFGSYDDVYATNYSTPLCSPGQYGPSGNATCFTCPAGTITDTFGEYFCRTCAAGTYTNGAGDTVCRACGTGTYSTTVGAANSSFCIPCAAGYVNPSTGSSSASACAACGTGRYQVSPGQATCTLCSAGSASGATAATSAATCVQCVAGTVAPSSGAPSCTPCAAGTAQPSPGQQTCSPCGPGTYSNQSAATCTPCSTGTANPASNGAGLTACASCSAGYFANVTGLTACHACHPGTYNPSTRATSVSACALCAAGTYSTAWAAASSGTCTNCPAGTYNPSLGRTVCISCPAATYNDQTGRSVSSACVSCPAGTASNAVGNSALSQCTACTPGTYSAARQTSCDQCVAGTFSTVSAAVSSSVCEECTPGSFSAAGASACGVCGSGTYAFDGATGCFSCAPTTLTPQLLSNGHFNVTANSGTTFLSWLAPNSAYRVNTIDGRVGNGSSNLNCLEMNNSDVANLRTFVARQNFTLVQTQPVPLRVSGWSRAFNVTGSASAYYALTLDVLYSDSSGEAFAVPFSTGSHHYEYVLQYFFPRKPLASVSVGLVFRPPHTGRVLFDEIVVLQESLDVACLCGTGEYYYPKTDGLCHTCEVGYFCQSGKRTQCPSGKFSFGASNACRNCISGWICSNGVGEPCLNSTYATASNGTCAPCPLGASCIDGRLLRCPAGTYGLGGLNCTLCEPGTYASNASSTACTNCSAGYYAVYARDTCAPCAPGTASVAGQACRLCPAGRYSAGSGTPWPCAACTPGTYAPEDGADECRPCPENTYASASGTQRCTPCPAGTGTRGGRGASSSNQCL